MENTFTRLESSLRRIQKDKEQKTSIAYGILLGFVMMPTAFFLIGAPIYFISEWIIKLWFNEWADQIMNGGVLLTIITMAIGVSILTYIGVWFYTDIRIILLLKGLREFNTFWNNSHSKIKNFEEILTSITSIHKQFNALPILKNYVYSRDSKYLFLQKLETQYFIEILTDLRSDLTTRLTEQQQILESAKSEVTKNIHWTTELDHVSELQKVRLDRQIEQFEELQRVLVKV